MKKSPRYKDKLIEVNHKDAVISTFILFVQTAQAVLKYADAFLNRKTRLSVSKLIVLKALETSSRAMMPSEIAKWTNTERNNITTLIARMNKDGLVKAERNSSDKRQVHIKLTDKGREVLRQSMPVAQEVVNQVMLSLTEDDAKLLKERLKILRQNSHYGLESFTKSS